MQRARRFGFSDPDVGLAGSAYLLGAVLGALCFGWLTDRLGRKKLFFITLAVYLVATALTGLAWNVVSFFGFRFLTGCRHRRRVRRHQFDNPGAYPGAVTRPDRSDHQRQLLDRRGARRGGSIVLLDPALIDPELGWRLAFLIGATIGLVILLMRLWIPESPRWLTIHGHAARGRSGRARDRSSALRRRPALSAGPPARRAFASLRAPIRRSAKSLDTLFVTYRRRTLVGLALMAAQAFFYNAIFFTYALILTNFYSAAGRRGRLVYPAVRGRQFLGTARCSAGCSIRVGRRIMIASTYAISGLLLLAVQRAICSRATSCPRRNSDRSPGWSCSSSPRRPPVPPI